MNRIGIVVPYFGTFPKWLDLFIEGCRYNDFIDFLIFSDDNLEINAHNIIWNKTSFKDYCLRISASLKINFTPVSAYKLCGVRPFYGYIHQKELKNYDFWGFCDLDLVFGNLRCVFSCSNLKKYDIISTDWDRIAGPLCVFRNNDYFRTIPFRIPHWQEMLTSNKMIPLDEKYMTDLVAKELKILRGIDAKILRPYFSLKRTKMINKIISKPFHYYLKRKRFFFGHLECTPEIGYEEMSYIYRNNILLHRISGKEIPYLHFLFFKKNMYRDNYLWKEDAELNTKYLDFQKDIFIDASGIHN